MQCMGDVTVMFAHHKLGNLMAAATSYDQHLTLFEWKDLLTHSITLSGQLYVMVHQGNDSDIQLFWIDQPELVLPTTMKLVSTCVL
jgi:hypothetical protein